TGKALPDVERGPGRAAGICATGGPGRRMGRRGEDACGPPGRGSKADTDIGVPYDHAFATQATEGQDHLWQAHGRTAELRADERKWSDFCIWLRGGEAGVLHSAHSNGVSGLRSTTRGGAEPV